MKLEKSIKFDQEEYLEDKKVLNKNKKSRKFIRGESAVDEPNEEVQKAFDDMQLKDIIAPEKGGSQTKKEKLKSKVQEVKKKNLKLDSYELKKKKSDEKFEEIKEALEKQYSKYTDEKAKHSEAPNSIEGEDTSLPQEKLPHHESMVARYKGKSDGAIPFQAKHLSGEDGVKKNNHGKDNYKTLPLSLRIRSWKNKLREIFHFQEEHTEVDRWDAYEDHLEEQDEKIEEERQKKIKILMKNFKE